MAKLTEGQYTALVDVAEAHPFGNAVDGRSAAGLVRLGLIFSVGADRFTWPGKRSQLREIYKLTPAGLAWVANEHFYMTKAEMRTNDGVRR